MRLSVQDNYPTMPSVASDLSPYYLAKARDNALYWKAQRAADKQLGGYQDTGGWNHGQGYRDLGWLGA
jgi:hypothetical protein